MLLCTLPFRAGCLYFFFPFHLPPFHSLMCITTNNQQQPSYAVCVSYIGRGAPLLSDANHWFDGYMQFMRVYTRDLSSSEVYSAAHDNAHSSTGAIAFVSASSS